MAKFEIDGVGADERYNPSRKALMAELKKFARQLTPPPKKIILDAGSSMAKYKSLFQHIRYETADIGDTPEVDYVCDLRNIPVEDARFDAIVFTQVMEHVSEPQQVLKELYRVMKPGGRLFCSVPFIYHLHSDYDYFRYAPDGLRHLFSTTGFEIIKLDSLESHFAVSAYMLQRAKMNPFRIKLSKGKRNRLQRCLLLLLAHSVNIALDILTAIFLRLEANNEYPPHSPKNFVVIAKKPER